MDQQADEGGRTVNDEATQRSAIFESNSPYYDAEGITLDQGDMREILPALPEVDLVVTDPPCVVGLASTVTEPKVGGWADLMNAATWYSSWLAQRQRLTAPRGHLGLQLLAQGSRTSAKVRADAPSASTQPGSGPRSLGWGGR